MRLIDADRMKSYIDAQKGRPFIGCTIGEALKIMTDEQPTVDAVPVRKGHWIERESGTEDKENGFATVIVCSCCDFPATTFYSEDCESRTQIRTDFCPNCGARMDGEQDGV